MRGWRGLLASVVISVLTAGCSVGSSARSTGSESAGGAGGALSAGGTVVVETGTDAVRKDRCAAEDHGWSNHFAGHLFLGDVASDTSANVIVAGRFWDSVDFGGGPLESAGWSDIVVLKLDPAGNHLWSRQFGGPKHESYALAVDPWSNLIIVGAFHATIDFGGGPLVSAGGDPAGDVFVAKLDPNGNHLWSKRFGGSDSQRATDVACDAAGNILIVGQSRETVDFGGGPVTMSEASDLFVLKLDPEGRTSGAYASTAARAASPWMA